MKLKIVTSQSLDARRTALKRLRATLFRLPVFNTFGCILENGDADSCSITLPFIPKRGAGAVYARHASLADAGLRIGPSLLPRVANATFAKGVV
jgi:hypothetical protein